MNKEDFYFSDGVPFFGIFREIKISGIWIKGEDKPPVYTIKEEDDELPSAHKIYMESLNEYDAAMKLTPSWAYWCEMLHTSIKIKRVVEKWREEKMLKDQAKAKALMWEQAEKGNIQAQKILYEAKKEEAELRRIEREKHYKYAQEKDKLSGTLERIHSIKSAS